MIFTIAHIIVGIGYIIIGTHFLLVALSGQIEEKGGNRKADNSPSVVQERK